MEEFIKLSYGADKIIVFSPIVRHSNPKKGSKFQPPAGDVHTDYSPQSAHGRAHYYLSQSSEPDFQYSRFVCLNVWRAISEPPQDWPLAVCDGRTVPNGDGVPAYRIVVDKLPDLKNLEPSEEPEGIEAYIFQYRSEFKWYYFSDMKLDEVLCFKMFDSNQKEGWRCPHTAFLDKTRPDAKPRASIEIRAVCYFK